MQPSDPPLDTALDAALAATLRRVEGIPGWLTRDQAVCLWEEARRLPPDATVVEIGSHRGRSTVVLAAALEQGRVVAVDPFPAGWRYGEQGTEQRFRANLDAAGVSSRVDVHVTRSQDLRRSWDEPVDLVYVDGKHDVRSAADDLRWRDFLRPGGRMLVHDCFGSLGVTLAMLFCLLPARDVRYVGRVGSLVLLEKARPTPADRARLLGPLPWFARNLVVKVLLRLRLGVVARALGHRGTDDPY